MTSQVSNNLTLKGSCSSAINCDSSQPVTITLCQYSWYHENCIMWRLMQPQLWLQCSGWIDTWDPKTLMLQPQCNGPQFKTMVMTSANCSFPVSTSPLASALTGIECLTIGWRSKISDVWKGAVELRSYLWAAMVTPTRKPSNFYAFTWYKDYRVSINIEQRAKKTPSKTFMISNTENWKHQKTQTR